MRKMVSVVIMVAMLGSLLCTVAFAGVQDFELVNQTGVEIHSLFVSPVNTDNWEEDVLGVDVLGNGESIKITFEGHDAAMWDLMVTDSGGNGIYWRDLDLSTISRVTLHWDGSKAWADLE